MHLLLSQVCTVYRSFQFQRYSFTINEDNFSFFVRTVPAWNALSPVSVRADPVAVFQSSICNIFFNDFYFIYLFIYLFIFSYDL